MTSAKTASNVGSIEIETVDFVKTVVMQFCEKNRLKWQTAPHQGDAAALDFNGAQVAQKYCNLEYPLLDHSEHFLSGLTMSLEDGPGEHVFLLFRPHHTSTPEADQYGLVDLTVCQDWHQKKDSSMEAFSRHQIETALKVAIQEDEKGLEKYRRKPFSGT